MQSTNGDTTWDCIRGQSAMFLQVSKELPPASTQLCKRHFVYGWEQLLVAAWLLRAKNNRDNPTNLASCSSDPCWPSIISKPETHIPLQCDCSTLFKTLIPVAKPETPASKLVDKSHIQLFLLFVFPPKFGHISSFIPTPRWF